MCVFGVFTSLIIYDKGKVSAWFLILLVFLGGQVFFYRVDFVCIVVYTFVQNFMEY